MSKLHLDYQNHRVYWKGIDVNYTVSEWRIMALLATKPGGFFSYRAIYDTIKGIPGLHVGDGERSVRVNVRCMVKRMRRKLEVIGVYGDGVIMNYVNYGYGIERHHLANAPACPTCGQIIICLDNVTVPAGAPPRRETVSDWLADDNIAKIKA